MPWERYRIAGYDALDEWLLADRPSNPVWDAVVEWIGGLADAPWQAPSVPRPDLSEQAFSESRVATVPNAEGTAVWYLASYRRPFVVELVWIGPESAIRPLLS